jgi:uncharacterized protein (UPF0335 family)
MSLDQQFNIVSDKLQQLLKQFNRLQKENEKLNEELKQMKVKEEATGYKIHELQQQVSILKVASGEMTERDKKEFEKTLNQYIKEVDKCISFLSE